MMSRYETFLNTSFAQHPNRYAILDDIRNVLANYFDLRPGMKTHVFIDGHSEQLLCLDGTIPVNYSGTTYNIPVCLWLMDSHPMVPPKVYVTPTHDMEVNQSKYVAADGEVSLPYIWEWSFPHSNLGELIQILIVVFGENPPVVAKSPSSAFASALSSSYPSNSFSSYSSSPSLGSNRRASYGHLSERPAPYLENPPPFAPSFSARDMYGLNQPQLPPSDWTAAHRSSEIHQPVRPAIVNAKHPGVQVDGSSSGFGASVGPNVTHISQVNVLPVPSLALPPHPCAVSNGEEGLNDKLEDLKRILGQEMYHHRQIIEKDMLVVFQMFKKLKAGVSSYSFANNTFQPLVNLSGQISVNKKGRKVKVPICIILFKQHPDVSPLVYVTPANISNIKPGSIIDAQGRVTLPYLTEWSRAQSDLSGLLQILCLEFEDSFPLCDDAENQGSHQRSDATKNATESVSASNAGTNSSQNPAEARTCKICMDADMNIVFNPCNHLVCCSGCAGSLTTCPICRGKIRSTIKIFPA